MKIFHLFANHKFTGPADPALLLATAQKDAGHEVTFISSTISGSDTNAVLEIAIERGLDTRQGLRLSKHFHWKNTLRDIGKLRSWLKEDSPQVIHCHLKGDHLVASIAKGSRPGVLVKSQYDLDPPDDFRGRLCRRNTDLWIAPTCKSRDRLIEWQVPAEQTMEMPPPTDIDRFRPSDSGKDPSPATDVMRVGVVARMQRHRRFPELIEAFSKAAKTDSRLVLEILGRGTHKEEVAEKPAAASGLGERIRFPGYIDPSSYPERLRQFDMLVFLVPGSDGTCRAAREALASGVPVITSKRGLLPELIPSDSGIHLPTESTEDLCSAILRLSNEPQMRRSMAKNARNFATQQLDVNRHINTLDGHLEQ
mgnify:FL=1